MLEESAEELRKNLYRVTRTNPETKVSSYDPERFAWLVNFVNGQMELSASQGKPVNTTELIAALMLDFEELYKACNQLASSNIKSGLDVCKLSKQRTVVVEQRARAGFSSGRQRKAERKSIWSEWQACADSYWSKNPSLSKSRVGNLIAKKRNKGENPDTIRKKIKKRPK